MSVPILEGTVYPKATHISTQSVSGKLPAEAGFSFEFVSLLSIFDYLFFITLRGAS